MLDEVMYVERLTWGWHLIAISLECEPFLLFLPWGIWLASDANALLQMEAEVRGWLVRAPKGEGGKWQLGESLLCTCPPAAPVLPPSLLPLLSLLSNP